jgi:hypothetical protein
MTGEFPPPDLDTVKRSLQDAREGRGCTIDDILEELEEKEVSMTDCERPDRDVPGIICGHPLPCPYHTVTIDTTDVVPTVKIPVTSVPVIKRETLEVLKEIACSIHEEKEASMVD